MTPTLDLRTAPARPAFAPVGLLPSAGWAAAAGLLVLLPNFSASPFVGDYDSQRLLELAAGSMLVVAVTAVPSVRASWLAAWARVPSWAVACVAALGALGVASAAMAPRPGYAFAEVASFAMMGVGIVAVASVGRSGARAGLALVAVAMLGGYAASVLPFHVVDLVSGSDSVWPARHLGFIHMRHLNQLQVWLLPIVWALAAASPDGWKRAGLRAVAVVTIALLVATSGRGILLALPLGLVVAVLTIRQGRGALLREAAVSAGLGAGTWAALFAGSLTVLDRAEAGLNGRGELWAGALRMIAEHPWLGVGPMHFVYAPSPAGAHPHNLALQIAAEWGAPAALAAGTLVLGAGVCWLRHARRTSAAPPDAVWMGGLTAAFSGAMAYSLVDGLLIAPLSQIVAVLVLGALLAEALPAARPAPTTHRPWREAALACVALPALAVLLAIAASDGPSLGSRAYDLRMTQVATGLPRFWSTGQIAGVLPPEQARRWPEAIPDADSRSSPTRSASRAEAP